MLLFSNNKNIWNWIIFFVELERVCLLHTIYAFHAALSNLLWMLKERVCFYCLFFLWGGKGGVHFLFLAFWSFFFFISFFFCFLFFYFFYIFFFCFFLFLLSFFLFSNSKMKYFSLIFSKFSSLFFISQLPKSNSDC